MLTEDLGKVKLFFWGSKNEGAAGRDSGHRLQDGWQPQVLVLPDLEADNSETVILWEDPRPPASSEPLPKKERVLCSCYHAIIKTCYYLITFFFFNSSTLKTQQNQSFQSPSRSTVGCQSLRPLFKTLLICIGLNVTILIFITNDNIRKKRQQLYE